MTDDEQLQWAVRRTLRIRSELVAQSAANLAADLRLLRQIDARLADAGSYPDFEATIDSASPACYGLEVGE